MNIEQLSKQLTHDEYEKGRDLFYLLRERGINVSKAAGMVYRAGLIDKKQEIKASHGKEIQRLQRIISHLKKQCGIDTRNVDLYNLICTNDESQPKAIEEGDINNERE